MKILAIVGILLFLIGGLALLIGLVVCFNTWNSDYATLACQRAEQDREKFEQAKAFCRGVDNDCYRQATVGLTSADECQDRKEYMQKQMLMGAVPAVIGFLLGLIGLMMAVAGFVVGRRKRAVAAPAA